MKALVVGGTGFIGVHIVNDLISRGIQVRILSRKKISQEFKRNREIEHCYGDVRNIDSLKNGLEAIDYVFSAFGLLGSWHIPEQRYKEINADGVKNLLRACLSHHIRHFIHISSAGVLGPLPKNVIADESFPLKPSNIYERTKSEAEKEIFRFCEEHSIPFTIIRPEFVYGPGDTHVLGLFKAIKERRFFILGNGKSLLHPTYVDDLVQGLSLCLGNNKALGQTFLITGKKPLSVNEIVHIISEELDVAAPKIRIPLYFAQSMASVLEMGGRIIRVEPMLTRSRVKFFTQNRAFSFQKAHRMLGYTPRTDFKHGARKTISWYRENGYL